MNSRQCLPDRSSRHPANTSAAACAVYQYRGSYQSGRSRLRTSVCHHNGLNFGTRAKRFPERCPPLHDGCSASGKPDDIFCLYIVLQARQMLFGRLSRRALSICLPNSPPVNSPRLAALGLSSLDVPRYKLLNRNSSLCKNQGLYCYLLYILGKSNCTVGAGEYGGIPKNVWTSGRCCLQIS
ncbi:hypothetical protein D3C81_1663490 [compost metagenome]